MKETAVREALRRLRKVQGEMQFASGMMPLDRQIERLRLSLGKLERAIYGRPKTKKARKKASQARVDSR